MSSESQPTSTPRRSAPSLSRRDFLRNTSVLVIGVGLSGCAPGQTRMPMLSGENDGPAHSTPFAPDAFVRISTDDVVTVVIKHIEFGQGPYTGLATLVAEELDADWDQMRAVPAPADDEKYKNLKMGSQGTGGSTAIANSYYQMRKAGAAARQMLVGAAAAEWGVAADEILISKGQIRHPGSGRTGRFGDFVTAAATQPIPTDPALKNPEDFVYIGHEMPRIDSFEKSHGTAQFAIDVHREDMLTVVVAHPPKFGGRMSSIDDRAARAVRGVVDVRAIPQGVAVYGTDTFAAIQGRRALKVEWDESAVEKRSSEDLFSLFSETAKSPGVVSTNKGNAQSALSAPDVRRIEAEYRFPYLAHAMMEPLDAVIENHPDGEGALVHMGCQAPTRDQREIAKILGFEADQVQMEVMLAGGSFGRRSTGDTHFAKEVAEVFRAQSEDATKRRPTKLLYTREDDIQGGYYRPLVVHRVSAAISAEGQILGWDHAIAAQSFFNTPELKARLKGGPDPTMVEGASDLPYTTDNLHVSSHTMESAVPILWWRSVGHTHTAFAVETMLDELLESVDIDPVAGRLQLLADHPRRRAVLERAAEMADWGRPLPPGRALGVAIHKSFGSYVAQIVEIEGATAPDRPMVRRVWCAVDCGVAVNPNVIRAQMEGGIGFGLGAALYSEIHVESDGAVREKNFDTYRNLRLNEMPTIEVSIIASGEDPTGVGEPGVPPIAPAVANAWRRLTGKRVERLPMVRSV